LKQIYIEDSEGLSIKIHDIEDATCVYSVKRPIEGLEFPAIRTGQYTNAGADGINIVSQYLGERRVQLTGFVSGLSSSAFVGARQTFLAALRPKYSATGLLVDKWLRMTAMDGNTYRLLGEVVGATMPNEYLTYSEFAIDFLANSNVIESYTLHTETINTRTFGGFILPVDVPIVFAGGGGLTKIINNAGGATAYPVLTFYGPLTTPRLMNTTTSKIMSLATTIAAGQSITVKMLNRTITQGGTTNKMYTMSTDSSFWGMPSGDNIFSLNSTVSGEAGYVTVEWRDAYAGI